MNKETVSLPRTVTKVMFIDTNFIVNVFVPGILEHVDKRRESTHYSSRSVLATSDVGATLKGQQATERRAETPSSALDLR